MTEKDGSEKYIWSFSGLITDLALENPPDKISNSRLTISGNTVTLGIGVSGCKRVAQFNADEIVDVLFQDGSPGVGSAALFGILGGLVGGRVLVVVILRNGCRVMFPCGWRTNSNRQRAARIAGEIKQAVGLQPEQSQEKIITSSRSDSNTKECPYCAEIIKAKAIICRYCGSELAND
jgi:hypothetical protein